MPHKRTSLSAWTLLLAAASLPGLYGRSQAQAPAQEVPARTVDLLVTVTDTPEAGPADTGKDTYIPGSDVIYTVVVTNRGAQGVKGISVKGALPPGVDKASWVCSMRPRGACGAAAGTGALSEQVDLASHAAATFLVTLTPPPGAVDVMPANLTATDTDAPRPPGATAPLQSPTIGAGGTGVSSLRGRPTLGGTLPGFLGEAPFACDPTMYVSAGSSGTSPTSLSTIDTTTSPFGSTTLGTATIAYNGMGFNPVNNFLYAFKNGTNQLYQIHSDGSATLVGTPTGLPAPKDGYTSADISPTGIMYIREQNDNKTLYTIDLTVTPLKVKTFAVSQSLAGTADLAWINGLLYAVLVDMTKQTATVATVDPTSGAVKYLPTVNNGFTNNVGALFGSSAGLYGIENTGSVGTFFQFDLITGRATKLSTTSFPVGSSDGAHCSNAPLSFKTDLQVTKTNTPAQGPNDLPNDTYVPGMVVYTIVVTNNGPTGVQNAPVKDPLPPGITTGSWTCSATGNGVCGAASGTGGIVDNVGLEVGDTATYLLTLTVPASYPITHPQLTNTVTISMPPGFISPNPSHLTATDTDPAAADLRVVKTTPAASVAVGDTLTYTIAADNVGASDVANSVLTDTADSRLDCTAAGTAVPCTATGGGVCPATPATVASLLGAGVTIPLLPVGGKTVFTLTCRVTSAAAAKSAVKPPKPK
jgi:uncharacterized repeat protein (TIGR01451 family)